MVPPGNLACFMRARRLRISCRKIRIQTTPNSEATGGQSRAWTSSGTAGPHSEKEAVYAADHLVPLSRQPLCCCPCNMGTPLRLVVDAKVTPLLWISLPTWNLPMRALNRRLPPHHSMPDLNQLGTGCITLLQVP